MDNNNNNNNNNNNTTTKEHNNMNNTTTTGTDLKGITFEESETEFGVWDMLVDGDKIAEIDTGGEEPTLCRVNYVAEATQSDPFGHVMLTSFPNANGFRTSLALSAADEEQYRQALACYIEAEYGSGCSCVWMFVPNGYGWRDTLEHVLGTCGEQTEHPDTWEDEDEYSQDDYEEINIVGVTKTYRITSMYVDYFAHTDRGACYRMTDEIAAKYWDDLDMLMWDMRDLAPSEMEVIALGKIDREGRVVAVEM